MTVVQRPGEPHPFSNRPRQDARTGETRQGAFRALLESGGERGPPAGVERPGVVGAASAARFNEFGFFAAAGRAAAPLSPQARPVPTVPEPDDPSVRAAAGSEVRAMGATIPAAVAHRPAARLPTTAEGGIGRGAADRPDAPASRGSGEPALGEPVALPRNGTARLSDSAPAQVEANRPAADARRGPGAARVAPSAGRLPMRTTLCEDRSGAHVVLRVDGLDENDRSRLLDEAGQLLRELGLGPAALTVNGRGHRTGRQRGERQ